MEKMRGNGYKLHGARFHLDVGKKFFTERITGTGPPGL